MLSFQRLAFLLATAISLGSTAWATPLASSSQASLVSSLSEPDPSFAVSVELGGVTYVNKVCVLLCSVEKFSLLAWSVVVTDQYCP